ncbi:hypothetical protein [Marinifilum sp.]|uniref:hypothetical protein n=1 Tax=Marinifilum sp. TaxID=2033137 RepID=UPI003BAA74D0
MGRYIKYGFVVTFIWVGFILAISFMESWVKFRAESLELATALDVGVHVFGALNLVERIFTAITLVYVFVYYTDKFVVVYGLTIFTFVVAQSGYLLPELNEHAVLIMQGMQAQESSVHLLYVVMEVIKLICLLLLGFRQVRLYRKG